VNIDEARLGALRAFSNRAPACLGIKKAAAEILPPLRIHDQPILDEVDLSRKIRGNFEANFLLTNGRLRPGLHGVLH
jgi:hypothetical protein